MAKYKKYALAVLVVLSLMLPLFAYSGKEEYKVLETQKGVPAGKEFVIGFDEPISKASINNSNVYVIDSKGNKVITEVDISGDGKDIIIKPLEPYKNDQSYTLYIRKTVRYTTGRQLEQGIKMNFSITPYKERLPVADSREKLLQLLEDADEQMYWAKSKVRGLDFITNAPAGTAAKSAEKVEMSLKDYSGTNLQVQGVDEADIVKTDGEYIYQVSGDAIVISKAYPADKLKVVKTINYEGILQPLELYVDEEHMVVIGRSNMKSFHGKRIIPYYMNNNVAMKIYDISDKNNIREEREIILEGNYLSSRKVGSELYLISNKYINYNLIRQDSDMPDTPMYKDSQIGQEFIKVDYDDVMYFPDSLVSNYMVAAGLSLDTPKEKLNVYTYLGAGEEVYCSEENLYVAVTKYNRPEVGISDGVIYDSAVSLKLKRMPYFSQDTVIYRFALNRGKLEYAAKGMVPGRILNQFSMDEYDDSFRIATTTGEIWWQGEDTSKNNLFILDKDLKHLGEIRDIAPGEKIYSVRFMGDRAYMVTFRTVDPLFVIDLKDKANPKILGALKIPGYSDYLHPYDENHIIGFGKDTVEIVHKDKYGNEMYRNAYYLGMKIAMFDITDVNNPKELFVEKIGDRGTDSPLLHDHKALLFSKEKNLMAFPVTLMELDEDSSQTYGEIPAYGSFRLQGAYVYNADLQKGFQLKGVISHISKEEYDKAGRYWYDNGKNVQRILYIGDNLYTISNTMIKVNDIENLRELNSLELK